MKPAQLKWYFVVNPVAGKGQGNKAIKVIKHVCAEWQIIHEILVTRKSGDALSFCRQLAEKEDVVIIAVGGDGTMNECASALTGTGSALGLLPVGSGNGLARHLGMPMNMAGALRYLMEAEIRKIDVIKVHDFYSFNVCGTGLEAEVANTFSTAGKRGLYGYLKGLWTHSRKLRGLPIEVKSAEKEISGIYLSCSVCNSAQYGNNAIIAPEARINDGMMDIVLITPLKKIQIIPFLWALVSGSLAKRNYTQTIRTSSARINSASTFWHIDGEPKRMEGNVEVNVLPLALNLLCK